MDRHLRIAPDGGWRGWPPEEGQAAGSAEWPKPERGNKVGREPCRIPETEPTGSPFSPPAAPVEGASRPAVDPYTRLEYRLRWGERLCVLSFMAACLGAALILWLYG